MIGKFDSWGNLEPGIHESEWAEFRERFGINYYRNTLLDGLWRGIDSLRYAGCTLIYVDGSFVTEKEYPNDYDVAWDESGVSWNRLDAVLLRFDHERIMQRTKYGGEFFPASRSATRSGTPYLDFFQRDRNLRRKGIVSIGIGEVS